MGETLILLEECARNQMELLTQSIWMPFNDVINTTELRELSRTRSRFIWSNNHTPPILGVLDRIVVSNSWEDRSNLSHVHTGSQVGSDHNPLIVDTKGTNQVQQFYFRFNSSYLQ